MNINFLKKRLQRIAKSKTLLNNMHIEVELKVLMISSFLVNNSSQIIKS